MNALAPGRAAAIAVAALNGAALSAALVLYTVVALRAGRLARRGA
jgi:hypothetical protein